VLVAWLLLMQRDDVESAFLGKLCKVDERLEVQQLRGAGEKSR
jgi:hypothetical protein